MSTYPMYNLMLNLYISQISSAEKEKILLKLLSLSPSLPLSLFCINLTSFT